MQQVDDSFEHAIQSPGPFHPVEDPCVYLDRLARFVPLSTLERRAVRAKTGVRKVNRGNDPEQRVA